MSEQIAQWQSRSGKWWVKLYEYADGIFTYASTNGGGCLGKLASREDAVKDIESRLDIFQPDAAKTPMRRVL